MEENKKILKFVYNKFVQRFVTMLDTLDRRISRNITEAGIETRPVKSNGLWCCVLLPAVLVTYSLLYKVSLVYSLVAYVSVGIFFYCILFIIFMSVSCLVLRENVYGGCVASSFVSALLIYVGLGQGLTYSLLFTLPTIFMFSMLLRWSLIMFPKTYTIGEAMIVAQGVVLFFTMFMAMIMCDDNEETDAETELINTVVFTVLSTVGLIVTALYHLTDNMRTLQVFSYIFLIAAGYAVVTLHSTLGMNCIVKVLSYIFLDKNRAQLFTFWVFLLVMAMCVLLVRSKLAVKADTVTRKSFHILASLVFLSGIIYNVPLITLGAGVGFGLLILVETLRKARIEPISSMLQSIFDVYKDEKDCGTFAMTPMYLYAGLACPLLLVPKHEGYDLELLSGVLATGIGDAAASWFGSRYGFNKWSDSNRTLEGTTFNILSQVATIHALELFGMLEAKNALIRTTIAASVSGLIEAKTDQVDNLILPLTTLLAFQLSWFLR
ncbi:hypothetical protein O3G_MSEX012845 [Manduca sexta]|uniref:dolichol kinase n=1 Tax=Manduca sexta TaxID=7130 RepID=A0A922CXB5_MANSE|nr:hypothetical protein O3G_MSEX012845 [Manduca sexta]